MNAPKTAATDPFSQPACDFLQFLRAERGIDAAQALDLLGNWLVGYEPGPVASSHARALPSSSTIRADQASDFAEATPATTAARKKLRKSTALAA